MISVETPILETGRLILRPFCIEDAQEVFECWESDSDVAKYMFWISHNDINKTIGWIEEEIRKINSDDWYRWAILLKETDELIGTGLIYFEEEYGKFEIAYNLGKKAWGVGYTTEAMQVVIKFVKEKLGIREIVGRHAKENQASSRVMDKLGFIYVKDIPYECNMGKNLYEGKEYILKL
ncbi:Protein N-acetyltransferase, RimJ/RimL family [Clostridium cavendishii DSM 21758]|uniref:Protein N-acetyltransferase, RimJ/RimL family n=1 Tax=Clostridium cavendishii DSM 21758 TaxID=1121302 RepID=A0A1M6FAX4_9CLOT|nr:GNAT family N-acetyltransferase [Clostridium cavendishii]SHI94759.1 Protein N-acetyltransferase, RimJ/RimL family [Clostridium cavendishii DSM 21758]